MLQLSEFVLTIRSAVLVVFNNFVPRHATDRSKISSDQKRLFFAVSLYPFHFFAKSPFKKRMRSSIDINIHNIRVPRSV